MQTSILSLQVVQVIEQFLHLEHLNLGMHDWLLVFLVCSYIWKDVITLYCYNNHYFYVFPAIYILFILFYFSWLRICALLLFVLISIIKKATHTRIHT